MKKINIAFQGGGVLGSAYPGVLKVCNDYGYEPNHVAGTSAGSIVAALVAAGYTADELKQVMDDTDYKKFCDDYFWNKVPIVGDWISALVKDAFYKGDYFLRWITDLLDKKGVRVFGDLKDGDDYRLRVIASDLSFARGVIIPDHIERNYGLDADKFSVAKAVRMSMSIPFYFKKVRLVDKLGHKVYFVDGGLTSNLPLFLFKDSKVKSIGIMLQDCTFHDIVDNTYKDVDGIKDYIFSLVRLCAGGMDYLHIDDEDWENRVICIDTMGIESTNFEISKEQKQALYFSGVTSAVDFFEQHKQTGFKKLTFSKKYKNKIFKLEA